METVDRSFLGIGWSFPPAFRREWYGLEMLKEVEDVKSSIEIILKTITGERVMLPTFGCNLQPYVFESMDPPLIALMEKIVLDALAIHEPRIIVAGILSTPDVLNGKLDMNVQFDIIATNTRTNYVFPFYMKEATNIET
ncbi:MAG: GPW/gp25 family protein [Chitinophagaceae bacterium]